MRITFLAACNSNDTERMPLMIVGKAARPRPFERSSGADLGFDYHHIIMACMTKRLFKA